MAMLCLLLHARSTRMLSQALALSGDCCWSVWAFELSLDDIKYQSFEQKSSVSQCIFNSDRYLRGRPTNWWASRQPFPFPINGLDSFSHSLKTVYFAHGICWSFRLFIPSSSANCKKQKQSPWHHLAAAVERLVFFPCEILCKYMVLLPKGNRLETCLGIRSRSACCHSNFALVTIWNSALPLKKGAEAFPKWWEEKKKKKSLKFCLATKQYLVS